MPDHKDFLPPLAPEALARRCDPASLPFAVTTELGDEDGLIGQSRAVDAIRLSATIAHRDFNLFVVGPEGTGRHSAVRQLLKEQATARETPSDWVYVNNFEAGHKPRALKLPQGVGPKLRAAMEAVIDDLATDIPSLFESEEYQSERRVIEQEFSEEQEAAMAEFGDRIKAENVAMVRTPMGYMLTAVREGKLVNSEEYDKLPEKERDEIDAKIARFQEELAVVLRQAPVLDRERRKAVEELNAAMAEHLVSERFEALDESLFAIPPVADFLNEVHADIIASADLFIQVAAQKGDGPFPDMVGKMHRQPVFARYMVNVLVSYDPETEPGAPVVFEELPTLDRLTGRIDHMSQMGSLTTNFTMIKPGALHRANGGYLVLDARRLLTEPYAWDALKRSIEAGRITITSLAERMSLISTTALEPDPIPLDVRVVLIGDRMLHALLVMADPDFGELFKVQADFEESTERSDESLTLYARLVGSFAAREGLKPMSAAGVARLIDEATRMAEDSQKFSLRLGTLTDLMREAEHYAIGRGAEVIDAEDIERTLREKDRRASRIRDRMKEAVTRNTILIDTDGAKVGQINGLSVIGLGNYAFGRPSRITARVRMGAGKLIDIEREVELGGPLHSKGVMILSGYLTATYALDVPFSLHASLVFEQSYGGVDGDSASSAELYALLSALSDLPLDQSFAVTGSVNQLGEVQAIGGVNEKIEGFFETCEARGLTGKQGVLIPAANVEHLMLRDNVIDAARAGKFRIIPVRHIDEGIALLTGKPAGKRGKKGSFPKNSVNARVEATLRRYAEQRRDFGKMPNGANGGAAK